MSLTQWFQLNQFLLIFPVCCFNPQSAKKQNGYHIFLLKEETSIQYLRRKLLLK